MKKYYPTINIILVALLATLKWKTFKQKSQQTTTFISSSTKQAMSVTVILLKSLSSDLPRVRDLCVEQKIIATVSAGVKPESFLEKKEF